MNPILVLGAARSGITAVTRGMAAAAECTVSDVSARMGLLHHLTRAAGTYAASLRAAAPERPVAAELPAPVLAALIDDLCAGPAGNDLPGPRTDGPRTDGHRTDGHRTDGQRTDGRRTSPRRVLHAADIQTGCPNLKAAHIVLQQRPGARAVVVWRHGVPFVNSRLRAFPHLTFAAHCLTWSAAMEEMTRLCQSFESRVTVIEHGELLGDPASVAAKLRGFLELTAAGQKSLARTLAASRPGRTAAYLDKPVLDPARTGWAMPEIEMFRALCGEASRQAGHPVDPDAAERLRPLDLAADLLARGHGAGGLTISLPGERNDAPVVASAGTAAAAGAGLHLGPLTAGRRARLRLNLLVSASDAGAELRCDVVESLSRRPIFGRTIPLRAREQTILDEILPAHDGLLDFSFSQAPVAGHCRFKVALREAVLAHL
jgi:hypothetical protein